jgi:hypothetical protein
VDPIWREEAPDEAEHGDKGPLAERKGDGDRRRQSHEAEPGQRPYQLVQVHGGKKAGEKVGDAGGGTALRYQRIPFAQGFAQAKEPEAEEDSQDDPNRRAQEPHVNGEFHQKNPGQSQRHRAYPDEAFGAKKLLEPK